MSLVKGIPRSDLKDIDIKPIHLEMLFHSLRDGPVWDGDLISKQARDELIGAGLMTRVVMKGAAQGYQGCTPRGIEVFTEQLGGYQEELSLDEAMARFKTNQELKRIQSAAAQ